MIIHNIPLNKPTISKPRPSGAGAVWIKFGKKVKVKDFVQAGREGTEIKSVMQQKGGLMNLKGFGTKSDTSENVIDMSVLNPAQMGQIIKVAGIAREKIRAERAKAEAEARAKAEAEARAKAEAEARAKAEAEAKKQGGEQ